MVLTVARELYDQLWVWVRSCVNQSFATVRELYNCCMLWYFVIFRVLTIARELNEGECTSTLKFHKVKRAIVSLNQLLCNCEMVVWTLYEHCMNTVWTLYECENRGVSNAYVIATMLQYICKRVVRMLYDSVAYATCMNAVHTYAVITLYIQCNMVVYQSCNCKRVVFRGVSCVCSCKMIVWMRNSAVLTVFLKLQESCMINCEYECQQLLCNCKMVVYTLYTHCIHAECGCNTSAREL